MLLRHRRPPKCRISYKIPGKWPKSSADKIRSLRNDNKISDNKICEFSPPKKCHGTSQEKQRFGAISPQISPSPTPSKTQILLILSFWRLCKILNMWGTCMFKDQTLKKTRTLLFPDMLSGWEVCAGKPLSFPNL